VELHTGMVVWAGGITPRLLVKDLLSSLPPDKQTSRWGLCVDEHLRVKGADDLIHSTLNSIPTTTTTTTTTATSSGLWALGDCAVVAGCAPTAQAANQQGMYLGRLFRDYITPLHIPSTNTSTCPTTSTSSSTTSTTTTTTTTTTTAARSGPGGDILSSVPPFTYSNRGTMAYVGGSRGVADLKSVIWSNYSTLLMRKQQKLHVYPQKDQNIGASNTSSTTTTTIPGSSEHDDELHLTGASGFALWRVLYFFRLLSMRNVSQVLFDWGKTAVFGRDISSYYAPREFDRTSAAISVSRGTTTTTASYTTSSGGSSSNSSSGSSIETTCHKCGGVKAT
jgi:NADH dehydrogenase FAD-containing subunit